MTTPVAKVLQRDIAKVLREVEKHPRVKRLLVDVVAGTIAIDLTDDQIEMLPNGQPSQQRALFPTRAVPKKKVVL
jgi:hypothetical protein